MTKTRQVAAGALAAVLAIGVASQTVIRGSPTGAALAVAVAATSQSGGVVERRAGRWKTWVLTSSRQFRPAAPPSDRVGTDAD